MAESGYLREFQMAEPEQDRKKGDRQGSEEIDDAGIQKGHPQNAHRLACIGVEPLAQFDFLAGDRVIGDDRWQSADAIGELAGKMAESLLLRLSTPADRIADENEEDDHDWRQRQYG